MPRRARVKDAAAAAVVVAALVVVPPLVDSRYITGVLNVCLIYGIWATSWDFMSGLTGRENFGHALFIGAGAYVAAFLNAIFYLSPWWSLPTGPAVAVVLSVLIGLPTLRLRGPYFALAMLSAATIMQQFTRIFWEYTGGEEGINGVERMFDSGLSYYYLTLGALLVTVAVLLLIAQSPWGVILRAIRGDEAACQAAGINVTFYKIAALMISAAFAGLGGVLYTHYQRAITPDAFAVSLSITCIIMVYVGGMGTIWGPAGGAILLNLLTEMLRGFGEYRLTVYTLILIFILFFMPGGFVAPVWQRLREARR